jgi:hypothetical protein
MNRRLLLRLTYLCALSSLFGPRIAGAQAPVAEERTANDQASLAPQARKVPAGAILVKGAGPSATDRVTPLPEEGGVDRNVYKNQYFGLSYPLPPDWVEKFQGPPPSDSGSYVLAQLSPAATFKGSNRGTILIAAQDLFFDLTPAGNAMERIRYVKDHLQPYYKVERPPTEVRIAGRSFARFDYMSPEAQLHWYVLATQVRCHVVQWVLTSQDSGMLESLIKDMSRMTLPEEADATSGTGGGESPVCIADYAGGGNLISRVDPVLTERKFNPIPLRIIIGKNGNVRHVHVISAFPEQASIITDALLQWRFKPYMRNGQPMEVETGILLGSSLPRAKPTKTPSDQANAGKE